MPRLFKKARTAALPPGTLVVSDRIKGQKAKIALFDYTESEVIEKHVSNVEECFPYKDKKSVTWINIESIDIETIQKIDEHFGVHPLVAEDIVNLGQRPKLEDYGEYNFIVIKMIYCDEQNSSISAEQISLILGKNYVISVQETQKDVFDPIRNRIHSGKGRIRKDGPDYLAYALLDAIVDNYFIVLEKIGERIEALEEELMAGEGEDITRRIHQLKGDIVYLRKQIWPLREVINSLYREETKLIKKSTNVFLRDVYDHAIQVMDTIESFRDVLSGLHDMHMTIISNKMNEVMKVLTIFAAIFIPLTFMAGIYGMNFEYIPELKLRYGYFYLLGLMFLVTAGMIVFFKKKKWL